MAHALVARRTARYGLRRGLRLLKGSAAAKWMVAGLIASTLYGSLPLLGDFLLIELPAAAGLEIPSALLGPLYMILALCLSGAIFAAPLFALMEADRLLPLMLSLGVALALVAAFFPLHYATASSLVAALIGR